MSPAVARAHVLPVSSVLVLPAKETADVTLAVSAGCAASRG
jgi:hypothetical protein